MFRRVPFAFLVPLLAFAAPRLFAVPTTFVTTNGIVVTDFSIGENSWEHGGHVIRLQLQNPTPFERHLKFRYPNQTGGWSATYGGIEAESTVLPGARSVAEIPLPLANPGYGSDVDIDDGSGFVVPFHLSAANYSGWNPDPSIYATPATHPQTLHEFTADKSYHGDKISYSLSTAHADPWPADFRAYRRFSSCWLTADEFAELPSASRQALLDYAAAGGVLCLFSIEQFPAAPFREGTCVSSNGVASVSIGRGQGVAIAAPDAACLNPALLPVLAKTVEEGMHRQTPSAVTSLPYALKPPVIRVHVVGVMVVLLAFAIVAGPVLVFRLARRDRRLAILWQLPALSGAFSLLLVLVFLVTNGVTPFLQCDAFTHLDQRAGRAFTTSAVTLSAPFAPPRGLEFPRDAQIVLDPGDDDGSMRGRLIQYGDRQRLGRRWSRPGIPTTIYALRVAPDPRRLVVAEGPDGSLRVRNLLGAPVARLLLWDDEGNPLHCGGIPVGEEVTLRDGPIPSVAFPASPSAPKQLETLSPFRRPSRNYAAEIEDGCPFVEDPLPGVRADRISHAYVFGAY